MTSTLRQRLSSVPPLCWLMVLTVACLLPFINKAVYIDDTLFLRAAQQIQKHPANFYGSTINWFGVPIPMIEAFDNPPLACYYLALIGSIAGWSEPALHLAFLLPALAAAWGVFSLAQYYCQRPLVAVAAALLTPVFLISATTLMCDVVLLAFWIWALVWFEKGLQQNNRIAFLYSGLLAGLAVLTKFPGLALVPLLTAYALFRQRRLGWWLLAPLLPLLVAAGYDWLTFHLYGKGLFLAAAKYASTHGSASGVNPLETGIGGLAFFGGCLLPAALYLPLLWSRRFILATLCLAVPALLLLPSLKQLKPLLTQENGQLNWSLFLQSALFTLVGIQILALAIADLWTRRDPPSLLLVLWILGVFVFATMVNWTVNGRSFLPLVPAMGILVARRVEQLYPDLKHSWRVLGFALPAALISLCLSTSDFNSANSVRAAATRLCAKHQKPGSTLWFQGHWGFQYYMEKLGAKAFNLQGTRVNHGDIIVIPTNMSNVVDPPWDLIRLIDTLEYLPNARYATMNSSVGAGFHAGAFAPLPFAAGQIEPDRFYVFEVK